MYIYIYYYLFIGIYRYCWILWTVNSTRSQNKISKICRSDSVAPTIGWSVNVQHKTLGEENRQPLVNCMALMRIYPLVILVMTNSSPWYRWRLAIDGLPIKHGDFLWLFNHQMVSSNSGKETSNNGELMRNITYCACRATTWNINVSQRMTSRFMVIELRTFLLFFWTFLYDVARYPWVPMLQFL